MDGINKMTTQGKEFVRLARYLPKEDLHDLVLYLKTRQAMLKVYVRREEHKPLSLEQWYGLSAADRYMIFHTASQSTNPYLARFVKSWFFLKPWQKARLFVLAMWYYYVEMVRNFLRQCSGTAINK